jgi:hypothetical protein
MFTEAIQSFAAIGAIALGIIYLVGGLIVNLNLARRGLVEYQILKIKYLVVGLIFFLQSLGIFMLASLPAFALLFWANDILFTQIVNIVSMLAALGLLLIWSRFPSDSPSFFCDWRFWVFSSAIGAVFPMMVFMSQLLVPRLYLPWAIVLVQAVMTAALTLMAQLYHYSAFYYGRAHGRESGIGALDPIGVGAPTRAQFACERDDLRLLESLGVPLENDNITKDIYLIDETDSHYIISFSHETESGKSEQTLKVGKNMVKVILYRPDHLRFPKSAKRKTETKSK